MKPIPDLLTSVRSEVGRQRAMLAKGTPRPLTVHHRDRVSYVAANTKIADVFSTAFGDRVQQEANAELFALCVNGKAAELEMVEGLLRVIPTLLLPTEKKELYKLLTNWLRAHEEASK
jgi:hypothetical protein